MSLSTNLISGLSSGFDWRSMIDQLIAVEHRRVDLVENRKSEYEEKLDIFQTINTKLLSFKTQAETLASSNAFNVFTTSLSTDSTTYSASDFLSVSTTSSASPGTHTITMNANSAVAQVRKISSRSFTSYDTALNLSGEFVINGRAVSVETSDDLTDIRDKINNLNTGTNETGVTASILTVSSSNYRLILTSDNTGKDAFTIFDASADTVNILSTGLGFTDGTTSVKNLISNGFQSEAFSSSAQAIGSILGISSSQDGTVTIGNCNNIAIDLSQDSLTDIAAAINARATALSSNVNASVVSTTEDGVTTYSLKIENTTGYTDDDNVLQTLGLIKGDQGDVAEVHQGSETLYDSSDTLLDTDNGNLNTINLTSLRIAVGTSAGVAGNDTIRVTGSKSDGSNVDATFKVGVDGNTVQDLVDWADTQFSGSGNDVTVRFDDGIIKITDDNAGDTRLSILVTANNEAGGQLDFGTVSATTEGYTMEVQAGQDANLIIDGTAVASSSNIIDDVIAGVTINLLTVETPETGTKTVNLTVSRDYDTIKSSVQALLDAYNDVLSEINENSAYDEETETAGLLQGDGTLMSIKSDLVNILTTTITGLPSNLNALPQIGINSKIDYLDHTNNGMLSIDDDVFMDALRDNFNGVRRIFIAEGYTTDGDVEYISYSNETVAGEYDVNITQAATQVQETGNKDLETSNGIGAGNIETITITHGTKVAAITLNGDTGENGSSIDNIVNAINSEFDTEYAQSIMGDVKNTLSDGTTAITSTTKWNLVYSGGNAAGLVNDDEITFTGHKKNGTEVNGSYTISDVTSDTVQGLLSAIESAYDHEVSATVNTYGYLVITDNTTGNSNLDISITCPSGSGQKLDFGNVTTSNLVGSERNTKNTGANAIIEGDTWGDIDNHGLSGGEWVYYSGHTADGEAVEGSYQVALGTALSAFLTQIETDFGGNVDASIQDGRIVLTDGTTNSTLGIEIIEPGTVDFGALGGGVTGRYSVDVTASKDASKQLVLTSDDFGSSTNLTISQSRASTNTNYNQIICTNTANTTDSSDGNIYVSSSTLWDDIYGAGVVNGDTITISGKDRGGGTLDTGTPADLTYTIDVTKDIGDLLSRIENVFLNDTSASTTVDARIEDGKIIVEDQTSGTSQISLTLTCNKEGGGSLVLGESGTGNLEQSTTRDLDLGLVNGTRSGLDVVGTINGEDATGTGQALKGDAPGTGETTSVEGLVIKYTGTTTGDQGTVKITMGVGELFDRVLFNITDPIDGYASFKQDSLQDRINSIEDQIEQMEERLDRKMELMINRFVAMEVALSRLQNQSNWLTGQINASYSGWAGW